MDNQAEFLEYNPSPLIQIKKFVTRVWEHPLLDEETRKHRNEAKTRFTEILQQFGANPESFVTIPVGSLIWATDSQSDYDYQLVVSSRKDFDTISQLFAKADTNGLQDIYAAKNIYLVEFVTGDEFIKEVHDCVSLFFTPDEYIGGNVELARQLRLRAVTQMRDRNFSERDWNWVVAHRFDIFFRKWDDLSLHLSSQYKGSKPDVIRDRALRIKERLEKRAQQTHSPERYKTAFEKARNELQFPDFKTYSQAIIDSKGVLSLSSQYSATGVK